MSGRVIEESLKKLLSLFNLNQSFNNITKKEKKKEGRKGGREEGRKVKDDLKSLLGRSKTNKVLISTQRTIRLHAIRIMNSALSHQITCTL